MCNISFDQWFATVTGHDSPRPWQGELADEATCRDRVIRISTGLGKTEGVLAAWSFHRVGQADERWPRRLIWSLPMRALVEQTEQVARELASKIPTSQRPEVYIAMGGQDIAEWYLYPERPAIIIGTQDMLLSRALNRGYACAGPVAGGIRPAESRRSVGDGRSATHGRRAGHLRTASGIPGTGPRQESAALPHLVDERDTSTRLAPER